jgi:hypothetical protein
VPVQLDLNVERFQDDLLRLESEEQLAVLHTLAKIRKLDWNQVYLDQGLKWEAIESRSGPGKQRLYSFRITRKARAVGYRIGNLLRLLAIHPGHDSAYKK